MRLPVPAPPCPIQLSAKVFLCVTPVACTEVRSFCNREGRLFAHWVLAFITPHPVKQGGASLYSGYSGYLGTQSSQVPVKFLALRIPFTPLCALPAYSLPKDSQISMWSNWMGGLVVRETEG